MRLILTVLAILALAAATSAANARPHRHHTRIVIHPAYATQAWWYGSAAYPGHVVPLAAYPSPGGIGLVWAPFGWGGYAR